MKSLKSTTKIYPNLPTYLCFLCITFFALTPCFSQVGINTTTPDASAMLDVNSSDKGLLIPRVSLANVTDTMLDGTNTAATGLLIYNTNASVIGGNGVGYYSFNGTTWEKLITTSSAINDHDWYEVGTTTAPDNINDNIFTQGNVAIGKNTADYPLDVLSTNNQTGIKLQLDGSTGGNKIIGIDLALNQTGAGERIGFQSIINQNTNDRVDGINNLIQTNGNGLQRGIFNWINNSGTGERRGTSNNITGAGSGTHKGTSNTLQSSGNGNHYGSYNKLLGSGSGIHYGSFNYIIGSGSGQQFGTSNSILNSGNGNHHGSYNELSGAGNGDQFGVYSIITNTGSGNHYAGFFTVSPGANHFAGYFLGNVAVGTTNANKYIFPASRGTANQIMQTDGSGNLSWVDATSVGDDDHDWYEVGTTTAPDNINDNMFTQGKVAIGKNTADYTLDIENNATGRTLNINKTGNESSPNYGSYITNSTGGSGYNYGTYNHILGAGTGGHYGTYNWLNGTTSQVGFYGSYQLIEAGGSSSHYGNYNELKGNSGGPLYGSYNKITATNNNTHYGIYSELTGNSGNSEVTGLYNEISNSGTARQYGVRSLLSSNGGGRHYGIYNGLSGTGNSYQYGTYNDITNSVNGTHIGTLNSITGSGSGSHTGTENSIINGTGQLIGTNNTINSSGNGIMYGTKNSVNSGLGTGTKYGSYNVINSANSTNYGVYSSVLNAGSFAGYFLGNVAVGTTNANKYIFPASRGTANQIMQTDGSGNLSWVDATSVGDDDHDWYEVGTTTAPNNINDNIFTQGKVAIGKNTADYALDIEESTETRALNVSLTNNSNDNNYVAYFENLSNGNGTHYGSYNSLSGDGSGTHYGSYNILTGTGSGNQYGTSTIISNSGDSDHFGSYINLSGSGSGTHYGSFNVLSSTGNGTQIGVYSDIIEIGGTGNHYAGYFSVYPSANHFAGYFLGNVAIGTSSLNTYIFPASRGIANQIMQTDGSGNVSWVTPEPLRNASNGLSLSGNDIILGGTLNQNTTITQGTNNIIFNLNNTGDFFIQDNGVNHFEVNSAGETLFGGNTLWNTSSTSGTTLARLRSGGSGNDGEFAVYNNGNLQHKIYGASTTVFNELGVDVDFRIEGDTQPNLFFADAGNDRIGIMEGTPDTDIHLKQSNATAASSGGMTFEDSADTDQWKIYHSGSHFSFAENGVRRAYVEAGTGNYVQPSDERLKRDFVLQNNYLNKVKNIKIYSYLYKTQTNNQRNLGVKAQELQQLFPELISQGEDGYLGMNYAGLGVVAIQAIKELTNQVGGQQAEIEALKTKNQALEARLSKIELLLEKK